MEMMTGWVADVHCGDVTDRQGGASLALLPMQGGSS